MRFLAIFPFLPYVASAALTVTNDDFELISHADNDFTFNDNSGISTDWIRSANFPTDTSSPIASTFNPGATFYSEAGLVGNGTINDMDGANAGFIFEAEVGDNLTLPVGTIEPGTIYEASLAISGSRSTGEVPHGFSIQLVSTTANQVISTTSVTDTEAGALVFDAVATQFSSESLPSGVNVNDDLAFRIVIDSRDGGSANYLDFDNFQITATPVPEPSTGVLAGLVGLTLVLRRKRG